MRRFCRWHGLLTRQRGAPRNARARHQSLRFLQTLPFIFPSCCSAVAAADFAALRCWRLILGLSARDCRSLSTSLVSVTSSPYEVRAGLAGLCFGSWAAAASTGRITVGAIAAATAATVRLGACAAHAARIAADRSAAPSVTGILPLWPGSKFALGGNLPWHFARAFLVGSVSDRVQLRTTTPVALAGASSVQCLLGNTHCVCVCVGTRTSER